MDISLFRQQIEYMKSHFNIVTMEQVLAAVRERERGGPLPEQALLLTFDDGYIDNYTFAFPILQEFGVQGSFFIPGKTFVTHQLLDVNKIHYILASANIFELVEDVKKEMDYYRGQEYDYAPVDELFHEYAIASRFDINYWLGNLPVEKMRQDISMALDTLDEFIDRKQWVMNFPYGNYSPDVLEYIKSEGACAGMTTEVRIADLDSDNALELPRLDCNDFPPKSRNYIDL
ncbi:MAG: polysaccharide deacetylase family protein [Lachnospiraceae bacterium]|nr:polysaccharide deacetylase family protein [Lachnospiraceae bacterium]